MLTLAPAIVAFFIVSALLAGWMNDRRGMVLGMYSIFVPLAAVSLWIPGTVGTLALVSVATGDEFALIGEVCDAGLSVKCQLVIGGLCSALIFAYARYNRHLANVKPSAFSPARGVPARGSVMFRKMKV